MAASSMLVNPFLSFMTPNSTGSSLVDARVRAQQTHYKGWTHNQYEEKKKAIKKTSNLHLLVLDALKKEQNASWQG